MRPLRAAILAAAALLTVLAATILPAPTASAAQAGGLFEAVSPSRVLDTRRVADQPCVSGTRVVEVAPSEGVPDDAAAVSLNVTVTGATAGGFLTVYPAGEDRPMASNLNYSAAQTVPNAVATKVGTDGSIAIHSSGGCPNVIIDVSGYYTSGEIVNGGFVGIEPTRALDTRVQGEGPCVADSRALVLSSSVGVPDDATAVILNVTAIGATRSGHLTVAPAGVERPLASNLNYGIGQTVPNQVTTTLGNGGAVSIYASSGCPNVVVDVAGYFTDGEPVVGGFEGVVPTRLLDTRRVDDRPCVTGVRNLDVTTGDAVPDNATAVYLNVTATGAAAPGYLTVYPGGERPTASNLNFSKGQTVPNAVTVGVAENSTLSIYASGGCPNVIVDVAGYTVGPDLTPPELSLPEDISVGATSSEGAEVEWTATATDDVDGDVAVECLLDANEPISSPAQFAIGAFTVDCSATDSSENIASGSFTVTVTDEEPVLNLPEDITVEAASSEGSEVEWTATATDAVDGDLSATCRVDDEAVTSPTLFPIGETNVDCSATDSAENTANSSFMVTVEDTTAPVVDVPDSETLEATGPDGAEFEWTATATDLVDGDVTVECTILDDESIESPATFDLGQTDVDCEATDEASNTGSASFTITVEDTTDPVLTVPDDETIEAGSAEGTEFEWNTSATDLVDGDVAVECTIGDDEGIDSPADFPLGATTVNCTATDEAGNTAEDSFIVTVSDTVGPVLTLPDDPTIEATSSEGASYTWSATATDAVDGDVAVTCLANSMELSSPGQFLLGPTTVGCSATDDSDNISYGTFTVTVEDTTSPVVTVPDTITTEATSSEGAEVEWITSATDLVDSDLTVVCVVDTDLVVTSPYFFNLGDTVVTCSSTDQADNTGSNTFTVTVEDTTDPVLTVSEDIVENGTSSAGVIVDWDVSATDTVDDNVTIECTTGDDEVIESPGIFPIGLTTVNCTATDEAGNESSDSFTVSVLDGDPVLNLPQGITDEANNSNGTTVGWFATAQDDAGNSIPVVCTVLGDTITSPASFALGTTTVACSATDGAGNTSEDEFTVTIEDTTGPELSLPEDAVEEATGSNGAQYSWSASATDAVDGDRPVDCFIDDDPVEMTSGVWSATFPIGVTTVDCGSEDTRQNISSDTFTVTVEDTTDPVLTLPEDFDVEATSSEGASATWTATATDIVDGELAVNCTVDDETVTSPTELALGAATFDCTAVDEAGNTAEGSFATTVEDTTGPVLTLPENPTYNRTSSAGRLVDWEASALDAVDGTVPVQCTVNSQVITSPRVFPVGATQVFCTAFDDVDNMTTGSFTVTVQNGQPTLTVPESSTIPAFGSSMPMAQYTWSTSASDSLDRELPVECRIDDVVVTSPRAFTPGTYVFTCTANDGVNTISRSFTLTVTNGLEPV